MIENIHITSVALFGSALAVFVYFSCQPGAILHHFVNLYFRRLQRELRYIHTVGTPKQWVVIHLAVLLAWFVCTIIFASVAMLLVTPVLFVVPLSVASSKRAKYNLALEAQVGPWAMLMASNLAASPSIIDAIKATIQRCSYPIREEAERIVKDISLGSPLQRALEVSAKRIDSPIFSATISTLCIGAKTGGHLPTVLRELSENLREMERLQGVVRVKTAEGKTQAYVLAVLPFLMASFMQFSDPSYLSFFTTNTRGNLLLVAAIVFWVAAVLSAKRILKVDI